MPRYLRCSTPKENLGYIYRNLARFRIFFENAKREPTKYPYFIGEIKSLILQLLSPPSSITEGDLSTLLDLLVDVDAAIVAAACLSGRKELLEITINRYSGSLEEHFVDILSNIVAIYEIEYSEEIVNNFLMLVKDKLGFIPLNGEVMDLLYVFCSRLCKPSLVFTALMEGADPKKPTKVGLSYLLSVNNYYETYSDFDSQIDIAIVVSFLILFGADISDTVYAPAFKSVHNSNLRSLILRSTEPLLEESIGKGAGEKMLPIVKWLEHLHELELTRMSDTFCVGALQIEDGKPEATDKKIVSPLYASALFHLKARRGSDSDMLAFSYQLFYKLIDRLHNSTIFNLSVANYYVLRSFIKDNELKDLDQLLDSMEDSLLVTAFYIPESTRGAVLEPFSKTDADIVKGTLRLG